MFCLQMEEALFRVTITSPTSYRNWLVEVNLEMFSNTDIAVNILTLIKLKVEAGQRQHYIVGVTLLSTSM